MHTLSNNPECCRRHVFQAGRVHHLDGLHVDAWQLGQRQKCSRCCAHGAVQAAQRAGVQQERLKAP